MTDVQVAWLWVCSPVMLVLTVVVVYRALRYFLGK